MELGERFLIAYLFIQGFSPENIHSESIFRMKFWADLGELPILQGLLACGRNI
jgi:hypothetical protein